jgi:hypothetical protein
MKKLYCYISIPRDFNADEIQAALEQHGIRVGVFYHWDYAEIVKSDFVVALLKHRSIMPYNAVGIAAREKKLLLAIQHADYKRLDFLNIRGFSRCVIPLHKTALMEKEIIRFIKKKRLKPGDLETKINKRLKELFGDNPVQSKN